jgi:glycosyltransferase involved in cell wall biosynthesis
MRISIIIPTYNGAAYLPYTVESVLAQTVQNWELILVDDGSRDESWPVVQEYVCRDRRIRSLRQEHGGVARARNRGFAGSDPGSQAILFLDQDDVLEPDALETLAEALSRDPRSTAAHGLARFLDGEGNPIRQGELETAMRYRPGIAGNLIALWPLNQPTPFEVQALGNRIVSGGAILIRRSALPQAEPFDPEMAPADDYDLWLRLTLRGPFAFEDRVVLNYRKHLSNTSLNSDLMRRSDRLVRHKLITSSLLNAEQRRQMVLGYRLLEKQNCTARLRWAGQSLRRAHPLQALKQLRHAALSCLRGLRRVPYIPLERSIDE